jgi:membrane-associated protease RseP (regulator of RpoE activity)
MTAPGPRNSSRPTSRPPGAPRRERPLVAAGRQRPPGPAQPAAVPALPVEELEAPSRAQPPDTWGVAPPVFEMPMDAAESRSALIRIVLILAAAIIGAVAVGIGTVLAVILALVVMIMLHEFGHFVTAKRGGMKVTEYFLGFGPRLWSIRRGETEYGVKAIPAGGYVKIIGMTNLDEVDPADEPRTYRQAPYRWRLAVGVAGSTMHFLLAFVILFALNVAIGLPNYDKPTTKIHEILALSTGASPAEQAGFRVGDVILSVDGISLKTFDQLRAYTKDRPGQTLTVVVRRGSRELTLRPTTVDLSKVQVKGEPVTSPSSPQGFIGLAAAPTIERRDALDALGASAIGLVRGMRDSVDGLAHLASPQGISSYGNALGGHKAAPTNSSRADRPIGIVGIVRVTSQATDSGGLRNFLLFFLVIDVFIGVFNLLPVLPFDGGHVAIATYERVRSFGGRRYRADAAKMMPVLYAMLLLLAFVFLTTTWLDIFRPVHVTPP